jgi:integrase
VAPFSSQALALLRAIRPTHPDPAALIFATARGARLAAWDPPTKRLLIAAGLATRDAETGQVVMRDGSVRPHRHDLRRTGATMLGELGIEPHIIESALNHQHIGGQLAALYNRARYRPQVAEALQRLADALDGIVADAAVVVPLLGSEAASDGG